MVRVGISSREGPRQIRKTRYPARASEDYYSCALEVASTVIQLCCTKSVLSTFYYYLEVLASIVIQLCCTIISTIDLGM